MSKVRFGATYSERDDFTDLPAYARAVEGLGFDSLWVTENISNQAPALECFTALAFIAAETSKLQIGTSVMLLPVRNPILVAQTTNTLDILSGGRMVLGVALGDVDPVHDAWGGKISERGSRCDEALEVITRLWTEQSVTFHGKHYDLDEYSLTPPPKQRPHPPIWVGGHAEAVLRRTGRWGNGYLPVNRSPEESAKLFDKVDSYAKGFDRKPGSIARTYQGYLCLADSRKESARVTGEVLSKRYGASMEIEPELPGFFGPAEECARSLQAYIDIGVSDFVFNMTCLPSDALSQLELVSKQILPSLS